MTSWTRHAKPLLLIAVACASLVSLDAEGAEGTFPGRNGVIAFSAPMPNDVPGIVSIGPDGTGRRRLTHRVDSTPIPSPDGTRIAFVRGIGGSLYLHVMGSDGSRVRKLAPGWSPTWSPDGRRLAFTSTDLEEGGTVISIIAADGSRLRTLTQGDLAAWSPNGSRLAVLRSDELVVIPVQGGDETPIGIRAGSSPPTWSPDGSRLAVVERLGHDLFLANADGTETSLLVHGDDSSLAGPSWSPSGREIAVTISSAAPERVALVDVRTGALRRLARDAHDAVWSPDASRLAFVPGWGPARLFVVRATGGPGRQVTHERRGSSVFDPAWSPGGRLFFRLSPGSDYELMTVRPDGSGLRQLTDDFVAEAPPAWSPDGRRIAFARETRVGAAIHVMRADGTDVRRLTPGSTDDREPAWSPDGRRIVFARRALDEGEPTLAIVNADGTGLRSLGVRGTSPVWSPDGSEIAFIAERGLAVARSDGTDVRTLVPGGQISIFDTDWSPDGRWIVFTAHQPSSGPGVNWLDAVRPDGSERGTIFGRQRTVGLQDASFSPDGRSAVATRAQAGPLVVVSLDKRELASIPRPPIAWGPAWQPLPLR